MRNSRSTRFEGVIELGHVRPGKYDGFTVEALPYDQTRITAGGKTTVFNSNGIEVEEEAPPKPSGGDADDGGAKKKAPAGEKDWTQDVRSR